MTIKELLNIMNGHLRRGATLKEIYNKTIWGHGEEDGALIFYAFMRTRKHDKKLMDEFNRTIFVYTPPTSPYKETSF